MEGLYTQGILFLALLLQRRPHSQAGSPDNMAKVELSRSGLSSPLLRASGNRSAVLTSRRKQVERGVGWWGALRLAGLSHMRFPGAGGRGQLNQSHMWLENKGPVGPPNIMGWLIPERDKECWVHKQPSNISPFFLAWPGKHIWLWVQGEIWGVVDHKNSCWWNVSPAAWQPEGS